MEKDPPGADERRLPSFPYSEFFGERQFGKCSRVARRERGSAQRGERCFEQDNPHNTPPKPMTPHPPPPPPTPPPPPHTPTPPKPPHPPQKPPPPPPHTPHPTTQRVFFLFFLVMKPKQGEFPWAEGLSQVQVSGSLSIFLTRTPASLSP